MEPNPIDLLPYVGDDEYDFYAIYRKECEAMIAEGLLHRETLKQALEEAKLGTLIREHLISRYLFSHRDGPSIVHNTQLAT